MSELTLRPIRDDERATFIADSMAGYLQQKIDLGGVTPEQARRQTAFEQERYFPDGQLLEGHEVFYLVDENDQRVGRLWMAEMSDKAGAFIYDVSVEPAHQHRGHGKRLMAAAEDWARERGLPAVLLHVFGGNVGAIRLYERLGYATTDIQMKKVL